MLVSIHLYGQQVEAILDSGSSVSMVLEGLVPKTLPVQRTAAIACFHGHVSKCPVVDAQMEWGGKSLRISLAKVKSLPYALLLGRDAPGFADMLRYAQAHGLEEAGPLVEDGEEPGPSALPREGAPDSPEWTTDAEFLRAQAEDDSLEKLRHSVVVSEGRVHDERRKDRVSRVEMEDRVWFRRAQGRLGSVKQLLVPTQFRGEVLSRAHDHPWAGHQGRQNTLAHVLDRFYWPSVAQDVRRFCQTCETCQ